MIEYRVEITENAHAETDQAFYWISEASEDAAVKWYDGLLESFRSLAHMPERCSMAPESRWFAKEIRQLLYGNYRILFNIEGSTVYILYVRHHARDYIKD